MGPRPRLLGELNANGGEMSGCLFAIGWDRKSWYIRCRGESNATPTSKPTSFPDNSCDLGIHFLLLPLCAVRNIRHIELCDTDQLSWFIKKYASYTKTVGDLAEIINAVIGAASLVLHICMDRLLRPYISMLTCIRISLVLGSRVMRCR